MMCIQALTILNDLSEYPDNWDGESARAIKKQTIDNCKTVLKKTYEFEKYLDDVYPTSFGTVCLLWFDGVTNFMANAEISPDRMAFYADLPGDPLYDFKPSTFNDNSIDTLVEKLHEAFQI